MFVESRSHPVFCLSLGNDASAVTCAFWVWPEDNLSSSSLSAPLICESSNPRGVEQWKCARFEPTLICKVSNRLKKSLFIQFRNTGSSSFFMIMAPSWRPPFWPVYVFFFSLLWELKHWTRWAFSRLLDSLWCCNSLCSFLALSSGSQMFLLEWYNRGAPLREFLSIVQLKVWCAIWPWLTSQHETEGRY